MSIKQLVNRSRTEIENHSRGMSRAFMMGTEKLCCRMLGGPIMFCDPMNNDFTPWLGLEGYWEMWITMAVAKAVQPGWVCYDVGAAWGYYSILFGWCGASKVVSIEPIQSRGDFVALNMNTNFGGTPFDLVVSAVNSGLSDTVDIDVIPGRVCGFPNVTKTTFPAREFDSICLEKTEGRVDFMKVDIDGGEFLFWEGVQGTIKRNPGVIIVMEVNANRYADSKDYYERIQKVFPVLRIVTTDGGVRPITIEELIKLSTEQDQMVWLQN